MRNENILDYTETKPPMKDTILNVLIGLAHAVEFLVFLIVLLGLLERVEHAQFIPGVSLTFWGILSWVPITFSLFILYPIRHGDPPFKMFLWMIFGVLLCLNLLGTLEAVEHTQFIPGVSFLSVATQGLIAWFAVSSFSSLAFWKEDRLSSTILILSAVCAILLVYERWAVLGTQVPRILPDVQLTPALFAVGLICGGVLFARGKFRLGYIYYYIRIFLLFILEM